MADTSSAEQDFQALRDQANGALLATIAPCDLRAQWSEANPTTVPFPRLAAAMSFDPSQNVTVMFGGRVANGELADTWEWNGSDWTERTTPTAPPPGR